MKYCPQCGSEYRPGFERCPDCNQALVDDPPTVPAEPRPSVPTLVQREEVFSTGRRIDAEMVRGLLEAHGLDARIWASGMGPYRLESAVTEITGVPSAFNAYGVGVPNHQAEEARALLADVEDGNAEAAAPEEIESGSGLMNVMRSRWALFAAALFLLAFVIFLGPPGP